MANIKKPSCAEYVQKAVRIFADEKLHVYIESLTAKFADIIICKNDKFEINDRKNQGWEKIKISDSIREIARRSDILFVFGGDGTILRIAREIAGLKTPIVGINLGKLGFLTTSPAEELVETIDKIRTGRAFVESRPLIEAIGNSPDRIKKQIAVNDFVISRSSTSRMIELDVYVNRTFLTRYRCDGLIVCSPTGSTAYSLSAGGAIVSPDAHVFTITPICPHTLTNRSVVVSLNSQIKIKFISEKLGAFLSADGQIEIPLHEGDEIVVQKCAHYIRLVHLEGYSFFKTLRHKLNWSGSNV